MLWTFQNKWVVVLIPSNLVGRKDCFREIFRDASAVQNVPYANDFVNLNLRELPRTLCFKLIVLLPRPHVLLSGDPVPSPLDVSCSYRLPWASAAKSFKNASASFRAWGILVFPRWVFLDSSKSHLCLSSKKKVLPCDLPGSPLLIWAAFFWFKKDKSGLGHKTCKMCSWWG